MAGAVREANLQANRRILPLALPAILEMMLHMAVGIADVAMVGRLGADSLAAISLGEQILFTVLFVFAAIGVGAGAIVARHVGAREYDRAGFVIAQAVGLGLVVGLVLGCMGFFFAERVVGLFQVNRQVLELGSSYLKILAFPGTFFLVLLIGEFVTRSAGYTKIPLYVAGFANTVNIVLNYTLIYGKFGLPRLGVQGAAIGTGTAFFLASVIILSILASGRLSVRLKVTDIFPLQLAVIKRILRLAVPGGIEEFLKSSSNFIVTFMLTGLGSVAYAAHQVALSVESLSFMPGYGFAIAASILVGQHLGAKQPEEAEKSGWAAVKWAVVVMTFMALIFFFFSRQVVAVFTNEPAVISQAARAVRIGAFEQTTLAVEMVLAGALRGAGDARWPMYLAVVGNWFIRVPFVYLVLEVFHLGLAGVWWVTVGQWFILSLLALYRFLRGSWKAIEV
ncbi:MAG: MATE family efflux transporter [Thermoanaerobacteraceae bacterium]|nr:MATE family efflux transporter [Thermoanaerobacteraceae bacterium]